jgi:hypothetical protein
MAQAMAVVLAGRPFVRQIQVCRGAGGVNPGPRYRFWGTRYIVEPSPHSLAEHDRA